MALVLKPSQRVDYGVVTQSVPLGLYAGYGVPMPPGSFRSVDVHQDVVRDLIGGKSKAISARDRRRRGIFAVDDGKLRAVKRVDDSLGTSFVKLTFVEKIRKFLHIK